MNAELASGLRFEIERPGRDREVLEVDAPRALLGSGSHCEVRLGAHEAAPEHLLVRCTSTGLEAVSRAAAATTWLGGLPFERGAVPDGARFTIGDCRVRVARLEDRLGSRASAERATRPLLIGLGLASLAALVALLLEPGASGTVAPPPHTPPLWSAADAQACARSASDQARELGQLHWRAALMKQERSPYHLSDAMLAVAQFQQAQACFEAAHEREAAAIAEREFERLLRELDADFHRRRVLLERAIQQRDWRVAAREAAALRQLLGQRHADYTTWLSEVERFAAAWASPGDG